MNNYEETKKEEREKVLVEDAFANKFSIIIPQCCREGWDSCKHVAKKEIKTKHNIGL